MPNLVPLSPGTSGKRVRHSPAAKAARAADLLAEITAKISLYNELIRRLPREAKEAHRLCALQQTLKTDSSVIVTHIDSPAFAASIIPSTTPLRPPGTSYGPARPRVPSAPSTMYRAPPKAATKVKAKPPKAAGDPDLASLVSSLLSSL
jgi:hypothetical protein